jgi:ribosome-associated protein
MEETIDPANLDPETLATALAQAAADMKAFDIVILDMRGLVDYTDMFVLCTANNPRQVAAIADEARAVAKRQFALRPLGVEGLQRSQWVLVDFGDAVMHVFDEASRAFYNLDALWQEAPRLEAPVGEPMVGEPRFFR